ncbi:winged helix-turn-helix domain-containing protein [Halonotius pteroides]|uniref:ArsR family transcriptional regulator n=1 Tax=Halonotius pteroides TaxID=268735 RepID=A0A3A6QB75_9EURY|nr:winged helix-turn-helix domain-containing protein [Halonotius pteroides]RJX47874.1 ArsR family transcriptional regulator [Halonotius pteroides]
MSSDQNTGNEDPIQAAEAEWKASTTALERVKQVSEQTTTTEPVSEIATEALVSEPTARKHLNALVEIGTVTKTTESGTTKYSRDDDQLLYQRIRTLASEHSRETLIDEIQDLKQRLDELKTEYDAVSPETVVTDLSTDAVESDWEAVAEWQTVERDLHIAQAAINYERAREIGRATE